MASYQATHHTSAGFSGLLNRFTAILAIAREDLTKWRLYRETLAELHALGARELDDLDMNQADLERIAREAVYGPRA